MHGMSRLPPVRAATSRWRSPAWILFFLSPAIGELLTSAAPPAKVFRLTRGLSCRAN